MSATPARGRLALDDEQLVALAKSLPQPEFADARREEMRTAFLSTVRGIPSGARARASAGRGRRRRLLLIGALLCTGAGAAAAAWRIGSAARASAPRPGSADRPTLPAERAGRLPPPAAPETPAAPEDAPAALERVPAARVEKSQRHAQVSRPRTLALLGHREAGAKTAGDGAESAFARGWSALGTGDFSGAAEAFGRAGAGNDNPLTEDALFWRGVALDRAGRFGAARAAVSDFLARYPGSERKGEASVILGWLLVHAGEQREARERFARALDDPAERVRNSARAGLEAVSAATR